MGLERVQPIEILTAGEIFLPPVHCRFVVISDIDETVMETVVANNLKMLWTEMPRMPASETESVLWQGGPQGSKGPNQPPEPRAAAS
jgi:hypothetical protein